MASEEHRLALPAGYRLEEFRIERMLGKGGFGITYLAEDLYLEQRVAIKEHLPDGISTRADGSTVVAQSVPLEEDYSWSLESFVKEARALAKIQHPNVVRVSRLLEANGTAYMVMDYLEGESLDAYLARTPAGIREEQLLEIVLPILDGLEAVHRTGLLHRDVKPANIYLTTKGRPILLDFGAARQDLGRTITMTSMVSHGYSPFEQYQSKARQSAGTDIYAMGGVLYRAITGEKPPMASDRIITDELEPVQKLAAGRYSDGFLRAIDHALSVMLEDRPESVESWRKELLGHGRPEEVTTATQGSGSRESIPSSLNEPTINPGESLGEVQKGRGKSWVLAAVSLLAVMGIAGGLKSFWPSGPETREVNRQEGSPNETRETNRDSRAQPRSEEEDKESEIAGRTVQERNDNGIGLKLVYVPAGSFTMGSPEGEEDRDDDENQVQVRLSKGFWLGKYEVTQSEFQSVMGNNPSLFKGMKLPVEQVSWEDAVEFCRKLTNRERQAGRLGQDEAYQLPTEAQWEYACRAGAGTAFAYGKSLSSREANFDGNFPYGDGSTGPFHEKTTAVGSYRSNRWGLYDMHGNVWEWCRDWYDERLSGGADPMGGSSGRRRVYRGGSWFVLAYHCRSANRDSYGPWSGRSSLGFRVARVPVP